MDDAETIDFSELPQVFRKHVFACMTQRPPRHPRGSCGELGAQPLFERLAQKVEASGAGAGDIGVTAAGCLGFCSAGPVMVVYPEGIWYRPQTPEDVDEIVDSHLVNGAPVARLVMMFARS